jgi:hypothetical protein
VYGIDPSTDLGFLIGARLLRVVDSPHQTQMFLSGDIEISTEGGVSVENQALAAGQRQRWLEPLVGQEVERVAIQGRGHLCLHFTLGIEVVIRDDSDDFECYTVSSPNGTIVV